MAVPRLTPGFDGAVYSELLAIAERDGAVEFAAIAESVVAAVAATLVAVAGPEAAYNTLQRWADGAAGMLVQGGGG